MKKIGAILSLMLVVQLAFSQAKKPSIMVIPSDAYCLQRQYTQTMTLGANTKTVVDYQKAMQSDTQLRMVITKLGQLMGQRGFPLVDLEQMLKKINQTSAEQMLLSSSTSGAEIYETPLDVLKRNAKADIILDLDYKVNKRGPQQYITFNLKGLDSYTSKQVAGVAGAGAPSVSASADLLLEEAVLSHMDDFNGQLMSHFTDMFEKGREVMLTIKVWDNAEYYLDDEFDFKGETDELNIFIEDWVADNCVKGRFSLDDASESQMLFSQVRIPLFYERNGRQRAMDARTFGNNLRKFLRSEPFNMDCKVYMRGLGEVWVIVGEK